MSGMWARLVCFLFLFPFPFLMAAQELRCNVSINTAQIQGSNKTIFETLQKSVYDFMNNRSWTSRVYSNEERIECGILINITGQAGNEFSGTIQVQSSRPVFQSSYNTPMVNYMDQNGQFTYIDNDPLDFDGVSFRSNLTSVLAFYAYMIIGIDEDSFALYGGTESFRKAEAIVNFSQTARERGWRPFDGSNNNRYWFLQNMLDEKYRPVREFMYKYHRLGLDLMASQTVQARLNMSEYLNLLLNVYRSRPDQYMNLIRIVCDAKADEWVQVFMQSGPDEKQRVVRILKEIDPGNISKFSRIETN